LANIPIETLKLLREKTGASLSECKAVLEEADGNLDTAIQLIKARQGEESRQLNDQLIQKRSAKKEAKNVSLPEIPLEWGALSFDETLARLNTEELRVDLLKALREYGTLHHRKALALTTNIPPQLLQQLSNDIDVDVAFAAKVGRKIPIELARLGIADLAEALAHLEVDYYILDRISRFPSSELQRAVVSNKSTSSKTLEYLRTVDDIDIRELAFNELLSRGENPISELYVCGTGCEIDVFEVSRMQYEAILEAEDIDLVNNPKWGLSDQGQFSLPDDAICNLYVNDRQLGLAHVDVSGDPIDDIGRQAVKRTISTITHLGKCYAIRIWESKGTWYECRFKGVFDESKLTINVIAVEFGNEDSGRLLTLFEIEYADALPSENGCSTRGKGVSAYLVDENGVVTEL
jgi:hypothetical protein